MLRAFDPSTAHGASSQSVLQQSCVGVMGPIVAPSLKTWLALAYLQHTCLDPLLMSSTGEPGQEPRRKPPLKLGQGQNTDVEKIAAENV